MRKVILLTLMLAGLFMGCSKKEPTFDVEAENERLRLEQAKIDAEREAKEKAIPPRIINVMVGGGFVYTRPDFTKAGYLYFAQNFGGTSVKLDTAGTGDVITTELVNEEKGTAVFEADKYSRTLYLSNVYHDNNNRYGADAKDSATHVYIQFKGYKDKVTNKPIILRAFLNDWNHPNTAQIAILNSKEITLKADLKMFDNFYRTSNLKDLKTVIVDTN